MENTENGDTQRAEHSRSGDRTKKMRKLSSERRNRSSGSVDTIEKNVKRQRFANDQLPSPPPDPCAKNLSETGVTYERASSKVAENAIGIEDAFDHLNKLHCLMEEILEMRERNGKYFRRVRDLERIRVTKKAHLEADKLISTGQDIVLPDEDVGFAESLLGAMLSSSFELSNTRNSVGRVAGTGRVTRSRSVGMEHRRVSCPVSIETRQRIYNRSGLKNLDFKQKRPSLQIGTPKVSKWTRVKAAFKWEKAACTNNDVSIEPEVAIRYLKIPENAGGSSEISGPSTPAGTISSSSSIDDVFHRPQRPLSNQSTRITRRDENSDPSRRSRSLDGEASVPMNFVYSPRPRSKDNSACLQGKSVDSRSPKTPWGKVKDMMQLRRESIGRLPTRSISRNDDGHSTSSLDSSDIHRSEQQVEGKPPRVRVTGESSSTILSKADSSNAPNDFVDLASRRLTPTLTITVPSSEELRSISSPESITPSPPSPRQSYESGKSESYSQAGSGTSKEVKTGQVSPASSSSGILRYGLGRSKTCQGVSTVGDYKRQQSLKGESVGSSPKMQRHDSKWNKVKRAFLTSATSVPTSPNRVSSYFFDDGDGAGGSYSASASAEDLENESAASPGVQAEIQRNYRLLHDKFGTEFYRKLAEWERLKSNNSSNRDSSRSSARDRDAENLRLLGEERLTPEFKKKLEEWKRMNKGNNGDARGSNSHENRTVNRRRITDWQLWRSPSKPENKTEIPRLSEDFIKKMEEWKRIKSGTSRRETESYTEIQPRGQRTEGEEDNEEDEEEGGEDGDEVDDGERMLLTNLSEKRRKEWKSLEDEEFRSLERVLEAMEIDRQTRLSKLQRIVGSQPQRTQEVLIHTSTGLYRFEGISRKFTRKLYEWEKSQGISPELSTFRLLDPLRYGVGSLRTRAIAVDAADDGMPRKSRHRSKSVGCVDIDSWRTTRDHEKTRIRRPCSFSLNDIENIDPTSCIIASSIPTIHDEEDTSEDIALEDSEAEPEPEAVIIDIEDVIEETASPLRKYQPHQTPVYSVAGSETTSIAIPLGTVTARHEPSPVILIEPGEAHPLRTHARSIDDSQTETFYAYGDDDESMTNVVLSSSSIDDEQSQISIGDLIRAEGVTYRLNDDELSTGNDKKYDESQRLICIADDEELEPKEDSAEDWQMAPLNHAAVESGPRALQLRNRRSNNEDESFEDTIITVNSNARHSKKLLKTRRLTDTHVGYDWLATKNSPTVSNDRNDLEREADNETDENSLSEINDDFEDNPNVERIIINEDTLNKIVVPTASSSSALSASLKSNEDVNSEENAEDTTRKEKREAASVFVKTKRIVFSPFRREVRDKTIEGSPEIANFHASDGSAGFDEANDLDKPKEAGLVSISRSRETDETEQAAVSSGTSCVFQTGCSSLQRSPMFGRKDLTVTSSRERSANMRSMMRRYKDRLENDNHDRDATSFSANAATTSSGNSSCSGSCSPIWTTPLSARKLTKFLDRYEEAKKSLSSRTIDSRDGSGRYPAAAILSKSSRIDFSQQRSNVETLGERMMEPEFPSISSIPAGSGRFELEANEDLVSASTVRAMKIRRAKEHFLSMGKFDEAEGNEKANAEETEPGSSRTIEEATKEERNGEKRLSMSQMDIVKSASAGMINIDENTYERLQAAGEDDATRGRDSFSQSNERLSHPETRKERTSRLSQIANKFKRARLRRAKDRENSGMSAVLKLCRQSLLVDIDSNVSGRRNEDESLESPTRASANSRDEDKDNEGRNNERSKNPKF